VTTNTGFPRTDSATAPPGVPSRIVEIKIGALYKRDYGCPGFGQSDGWVVPDLRSPLAARAWAAGLTAMGARELAGLRCRWEDVIATELERELASREVDMDP
jgi:hypothetical protein